MNGGFTAALAASINVNADAVGHSEFYFVLSSLNLRF